MKLLLLFLLLLWLWAKRVVVELGVQDGENFPRLCGKKKNKQEAGANQQSGLTKFKVQSSPRWNRGVFLIYRYS